MASTKKETTLRCVMVLTIIAVVCGLLLAILNPLLFVPPSVDDLKNNYTATELGEGEWAVEELNQDYVKVKGASGKVLLVGSFKDASGEIVLIGMTIKTNSDAQLGECTYAIYIDAKTNKIIQGKYLVDGSTGGKTYEAYGDKGANFESYLVEINSATVFADYTYPQTGATKTLKAVNNAFIIAANYYYNNYLAGGGAQ